MEAKHPEAAREPEAEPAAWARVLMTEPDAALLRRVGMVGGLTARLFTQGLAAVMGSFFTWMFDLKVYGREGLGDRGYILCPNHGSYLDGFLLVYAVPGRCGPACFLWGIAGISTSRSSGAS